MDEARTFRFRKAGPSGYGEGRHSYHADDAATFRYLCTVEGRPGDWRPVSTAGGRGASHPTREGAARAALETPNWPPRGWKVHNADWPAGEGEHIVPDHDAE